MAVELPSGEDDPLLAVREYPGGERRLLYIEDTVANVQVIEGILERRPSVRLIPAMLGRLGLDLAREHHPAPDPPRPAPAGSVGGAGARRVAQGRGDTRHSRRDPQRRRDARPRAVPRRGDAGVPDEADRPSPLARDLRPVPRGRARAACRSQPSSARAARAATSSSRARTTCTATSPREIDAVRLGLLVRVRVELDAEEAEALADARAHERRVLADARGEGERVEAVERHRHRADRGRDAIREDVEREAPPTSRMSPRAAAERLHPGLEVQLVVERRRVDAALAQQVEERAGVDRAGARRHRHALERAEAHRRVDRAPVAHGRDRAAAAEVADDEPRHAHLLGAPLHRQAVEAVAADAPVAPALRHARTSPPRRESSRGRPCRRPRRAGRPAARAAPPRSRAAPARCAAARAPRASSISRANRRRRSRTGSRKRAPPWTTRCATATDMSEGLSPGRRPDGDSSPSTTCSFRLVEPALTTR